MKTSIENGIIAQGKLPGTLGVDRKAFELFNKFQPGKTDNECLLMAYAYAVGEVNAAGGVIVTAPTCGASAVVPAVIAYGKKLYKHTHEQNIKALAIAGLIGTIIKTNGSISGAEAGCQAEVGSACSMAAAA
jgi:L-serine dehydratase